jgi:hypothetical protein
MGLALSKPAMALSHAYLEDRVKARYSLTSSPLYLNGAHFEWAGEVTD